ncbi:hypothetical protein GCM10010106_41820 [Thermopolyspora flexuosa]|nr:hypothetical protein GCM10010106_41820 [Thermopolyspora flexuosa]
MAQGRGTAGEAAVQHHDDDGGGALCECLPQHRVRECLVGRDSSGQVAGGLGGEVQLVVGADQAVAGVVDEEHVGGLLGGLDQGRAQFHRCSRVDEGGQAGGVKSCAFHQAAAQIGDRVGYRADLGKR